MRFPAEKTDRKSRIINVSKSKDDSVPDGARRADQRRNYQNSLAARGRSVKGCYLLLRNSFEPREDEHTRQRKVPFAATLSNEKRHGVPTGQRWNKRERKR